MGGMGGRLFMPAREMVRFRGIKSDIDEDGKGSAGGGGGESPVGGDEGQQEGGLYTCGQRGSRREGKG